MGPSSIYAMAEEHNLGRIEYHRGDTPAQTLKKGPKEWRDASMREISDEPGMPKHRGSSRRGRKHMSVKR